MRSVCSLAPNTIIEWVKGILWHTGQKLNIQSLHSPRTACGGWKAKHLHVPLLARRQGGYTFLILQWGSTYFSSIFHAVVEVVTVNVCVSNNYDRQAQVTMHTKFIDLFIFLSYLSSYLSKPSLSGLMFKNVNYTCIITSYFIPYKVYQQRQK